MAMASIKVEFPRRQAMLSIREPHYKGNGIVEYDEVARVPVFVWPMPTSEGLFMVEHQDGTVQRVPRKSRTGFGTAPTLEPKRTGQRHMTCTHGLRRIDLLPA